MASTTAGPAPQDASAPLPAPASRLDFVDAARGLALVSMVVNHTARNWIEGHMTWPRYHLIYLSLTLAAPMFLFLVGFCLPLAHRRPARGFGRTLRRGGTLVLGGYALNVLVFPESPAWGGGVLQTIGFCLVLLTALVPLGSSRAGRAALLALAAGLYVAFALSEAALAGWVAVHPRIGEVFFWDFSPWPWIALPLVGLVLGGVLVERLATPAAVSRYMRALTGAGAACLLAFFAVDWWAATPVRFGLERDFILNRHWNPRGFTLFWIFGVIVLTLAASWYAIQVRRLALPWLVVLGRAALFLYFAHQVVVVTIVKRWLGVGFASWSAFWAATTVLLVLLVHLGRGWLALRGGARSAS
ncbi:MAG TPA: heparan-alpha-glucosaminide N-acetyltransferase domain-containing protein [Vicinamibacteria bacterium]